MNYLASKHPHICCIVIVVITFILGYFFGQNRFIVFMNNNSPLWKEVKTSTVSKNIMNERFLYLYGKNNVFEKSGFTNALELTPYMLVTNDDRSRFMFGKRNDPEAQKLNYVDFAETEWEDEETKDQIVALYFRYIKNRFSYQIDSFEHDGDGALSHTTIHFGVNGIYRSYSDANGNGIFDQMVERNQNNKTSKTYDLSKINWKDLKVVSSEENAQTPE